MASYLPMPVGRRGQADRPADRLSSTSRHAAERGAAARIGCPTARRSRKQCEMQPTGVDTSVDAARTSACATSEMKSSQRSKKLSCCNTSEIRAGRILESSFAHGEVFAQAFIEGAFGRSEEHTSELQS